MCHISIDTLCILLIIMKLKLKHFPLDSCSFSHIIYSQLVVIQQTNKQMNLIRKLREYSGEHRTSESYTHTHTMKCIQRKTDFGFQIHACMY